MISDEVLKFRRNPASFLNKDLSGTTLLAKTDSLQNFKRQWKNIEEFLAKKNVLMRQLATTADQATFLKTMFID